MPLCIPNASYQMFLPISHPQFMATRIVAVQAVFDQVKLLMKSETGSLVGRKISFTKYHSGVPM